LGVICKDYPDTMFAAMLNSPLIIGVGVCENYFASDVTALVQRTKNVIYIEEGEFAEISSNSIKVYNNTGEPVIRDKTRIIWDVEAAEKGGYEHFMLKEIMEQPRAIKSAIEPRIKKGYISFEDSNIPDNLLEKVNRIYITACGSAYHAACTGKYMIEELARIPVEVDLASEFRYRRPIIDSSTLVIVISQSGETADTIAALKEAKENGAPVLAIVNVVGSAISKLADYVIYTWAGPEIAVATTKGYTTQVTVLCLLSVYFAQKNKKISEETALKLTNEIQKIPQLAQRAIDLNPQIPYLAKKYHNERSMFFIGRNTDYAVCLEGSLKLKEISYIHSEAYAAGELKHGTIALIDNDRLVVALACNERLLDKLISNIREVKARGAKVLGIITECSKKIIPETDDIIYIPEGEILFNAVAQVIPLQLFAYYVALSNGCDIDKPKNLAKSVTVE